MMLFLDQIAAHSFPVKEDPATYSGAGPKFKEDTVRFQIAKCTGSSPERQHQTKNDINFSHHFGPGFIPQGNFTRASGRRRSEGRNGTTKFSILFKALPGEDVLVGLDVEVGLGTIKIKTLQLAISHIEILGSQQKELKQVWCWETGEIV